jgi:hypothetical protein
MRDLSQIRIIKSDGERVPYEREKLINAFETIGVNPERCISLVKLIEPQLYDGITARNISRIAYSLLWKESKRHAGRYRLKQAIMDLGPSGYPFEIFVGRLFESFGYKVKIGETIQGKCIQHEVDVVAWKPGIQIIVECKFKGDDRGKTTVQVPLYIQSRFTDIKENWEKDHKNEDLNIQGIVVTNTRFTQDAIKYAECVGLGLISWDYPKNNSLKYHIDRSGLHPLTSLRSLRKTDKQFFMNEGLVLCSELEQHEDLMRKHGLNDNQITKVLLESRMLIAE